SITPTPMLQVSAINNLASLVINNQYYNNISHVILYPSSASIFSPCWIAQPNQNLVIQTIELNDGTGTAGFNIRSGEPMGLIVCALK
ncbi:MAG: hypothetical protein PVI42_23420, partial [Desulfobacterales bacterium]